VRLVFTTTLIISLTLYRPADNVAFFITIIVKTPLVQISAMLHGMVILVIELGPPPIKRLAISRNLVLRMVLLIFLTLNNSIYYQVRV
jgi:hypothetical protein